MNPLHPAEYRPPSMASATIDLHTERGRELVGQLALPCDVVVENFRPGRMRRSPVSHPCARPSGLRHVNGFPDRPPVRPNLSLGNMPAGMHAVIGILLALLARRGTGNGQTVHVAIYESDVATAEDSRHRAKALRYPGQNGSRRPPARRAHTGSTGRLLG